MIHSNSFRLLRNPEFIQLGKDLSKIIADANTATLGIKKQHETFSNIFTDLDEVFKTSQKNPLTQTVVSLDDKRDNIFTGICYIVDGHLKHWSSDIVEQANLLINSIKVYGRDLTTLNYQAESASLSNLIDTWEKDAKLMAALTALNLDSWKNELKATNNLFISTYTNRSQADGQADNLPKIKALREDAVVAWDKLVRILMGKVEEFEDDAAKAPKYTALVNSINGVLDSYNNLISQRQGRKAAKNNPDANKPTA